MATINFNSANQTYRQLMGNGLIYAVPRFQRNYSWEAPFWEDLWQDIEAMLQSEGVHYMGFLVLQSNDNKNFDVIDGQQRLTTISLLVLAVLAHLKKLAEAGQEPAANQQREAQIRATFIGYLDPVTLIAQSKLTLNRANNNLYQNYLVPLREVPRRGLKNTERLLKEAYSWLYQKVGTLPNLNGVALAKLTERLADGLLFTVITVTDQLNAYTVFETLNARGVKLSSTDLLKNYLFSVVHNQTADEHELRNLDDRWELLVGKLQNERVPEFLRTHWISRHKFVRHTELFKRIREEVKDRDAVFALLRAMEEDADVYAALPNGEDMLWSAEQRPFVSELKMFGVRQVYPLLLSAYRKFDQEEMATLLRILSIITFRYNIIGRLTPNDQEKVYTSIALRISEGNLTTMAEVIKALQPVYVKDTVFGSDFAEAQLKTTLPRNKKIVRYLLARLERHAAGKPVDLDSGLFSIEHILPENPTEGWEVIPESEQEQLVYRLGNMTLLAAGANREIGNARFEIKKPVLERSNFETTSVVGSQNSEWTGRQIARRQKEMAKAAVAVWRVSQLS